MILEDNKINKQEIWRFSQGFLGFFLFTTLFWEPAHWFFDYMEEIGNVLVSGFIVSICLAPVPIIATIITIIIFSKKVSGLH